MRRCSFGIKFLQFLIGLFWFLTFIAVGISVFLLFFYNKNPKEVSLEIITPDSVYLGVPFKAEIKINNESDLVLDEPLLTVITSGDITMLEPENKEIINLPFKNIGSNTLEKKTFTILPILTLDNSSMSEETRNIRVRLSYSLGRHSGFEIEKTKEININKHALFLNIDGSKQVFSSSDFSFNVEYKNDSDFNFADLRASVEYPNQFKFFSASLPPSSLNNYWKLGELQQGLKSSFSIKGIIEGGEGSVFRFPMVFYAVFGNKEYPIAKTDFQTSIASPLINLNVLLNGKENYTARIGEVLNYTIRYQNMSGVALSNVSVQAVLTSELFDFNSLNTDGLFNGSKKTIVWNTNNSSSSFSILEPGVSGELSFSVKLKNQFLIKRLSDKNFSLKVNVLAESPSRPYYLSALKTTAQLEKITKVLGLTAIEAKVFYNDSTSGFVNSGLFPPRTGNPTQYTVHWLIKNYSTDISRVIVKAILESNVKWTGLAKSNTETAPYYDELKNEVRWEIEKISATQGVLGVPFKGIFQIEAVPDQSLLGRFQPLLGNTFLSATDDFTGLTLQGSDLSLTTEFVDGITRGIVY